MAQVYLDHAATTHLRPDSRAALIAALDVLGNPASIHTDGQRARQLLEDSREQVAAAVGASGIEIIFTGGGTESVNLALKGLWWRRRPGTQRVLMVAGEHHATLDTAAGLGWGGGKTGRPSTPWRGWPLTRGPPLRWSRSMRWVECGWRHSMRHWLTRDRSRPRRCRGPVTGSAQFSRCGMSRLAPPARVCRCISTRSLHLGSCRLTCTRCGVMPGLVLDLWR